MNTYHSQTAYWYGYEAAITNKPKPQSKYQSDVDLGYSDGKQDLRKQAIEAMEGGVWK